MYWMLLLGALGQTPDAHHVRTISEIRHQLNRFDELDKIALQARAATEAASFKPMLNDERRKAVEDRLKAFAMLELDVNEPFQDAEVSLMQNLADTACKQYDYVSTISKKDMILIPPTPNNNVKGWYNTANGQVWGWREPETGYIRYYQEEQPVAPAYTKTLKCTKNGCYYQ